MPEIKRYRKKPVECEAIELRAYGDFTRARDWINDNGGNAFFSSNHDGDQLLINTLEGTMEARVGWCVVRGVRGEFYPCRKDIFEASHECVEPPVKDEARPGSGSSNVPHDSAPSGLSGGAAKKIKLRSDGTDGSWAGD